MYILKISLCEVMTWNVSIKWLCVSVSDMCVSPCFLFVSVSWYCRRPCSDFMDMLRRLINYHIIIRPIIITCLIENESINEWNSLNSCTLNRKVSRNIFFPDFRCNANFMQSDCQSAWLELNFKCTWSATSASSIRLSVKYTFRDFYDADMLAYRLAVMP